eukprot:8173647-Heterocapsa_arctica.AAC.1
MRHELPEPAADPAAWLAFLTQFPRKACNVLDLCTFVNRLLDNVAHSMPVGIAQFTCEVCPPPRP